MIWSWRSHHNLTRQPLNADAWLPKLETTVNTERTIQNIDFLKQEYFDGLEELEKIVGTKKALSLKGLE